MLRLSHVLVTLPLMAMPLSALAVKPALASGGAAAEAVRLLSKAQAADRKCQYLSSSERNELSRYAARAEAAAAQQSAASTARSAIQAGMADGQGAACSADLKADVRETLEAARAAVAESNRMAPAKPRQEATRVATRTDDGEPSVRMTGRGLGFYARVVKAYYLERTCRSLPRRDADQFWKSVVKLHRQAVSQNGATAVARIMVKAERSASGSTCGQNVMAQIERGYQDISSR